jgi:indole-3-glycerol phosphate synthase / phosphoribosylanthranilate isomerase
MSVLDDIVSARRARVAREGPALGVSLPAARACPVVPFGEPPFLVCEVKRHSPSRGEIAGGIDAADQAGAYALGGVRSISVLTEEDHFRGSLTDILDVKARLPGVAVLRKDFLLDREDIEVSWRAGADAVLLIASILDAGVLADLHARARALGMQALVEVHDEQDVAKCRPFAPPLVGINSRDLRTFAIDLLHPVRLRPLVDWNARVLFESGIRTAEDVRLARSAGFAGVLVGEAAMRRPQGVPALLAAVGATVVDGGFWPRLCARMKPGRPLVKICGITRVEDAQDAAALGADALGFVFAESRRRAAPALLRDLRGLQTLKVAVVVSQRTEGRPRLDPEVSALLEEGLLDAVQFHGDESPTECAALAFPYYKAVRVRDSAAVGSIGSFSCPRVLADAYSAQASGGTGQKIPAELAREAAKAGPLWLAGGLSAENIGEALRDLHPELVDASSRLEGADGGKDRGKLESFFREIEAYAAR